MKNPFLKAQPVWLAGFSAEKNIFAGFRFQIPATTAQSVKIRLATTGYYKLYVDGGFFRHGPARGPKGYLRVDEWVLAGKVGEQSWIAVEVTVPNVFCYSQTKQTPCIVMEAFADGQLIAATGGEMRGVEAFVLSEYIQKVQRYTFQRGFTESVRLSKGIHQWRIGAPAVQASAPVEVVGSWQYLPRRIHPLSDEVVAPVWRISSGHFSAGHPVERRLHLHANTAPNFEVFDDPELESIPSLELQGIRLLDRGERVTTDDPDPGEKWSAGQFVTWDFGRNKTGFLGAQITAHTPARLILIWDEKLFEGEFDLARLNGVSVSELTLDSGGHSWEMFQQFTFKYLRIHVMEGSVSLQSLYIREDASADYDAAQFACDDQDLNIIFEAARETLRQNATDVFMDCPSRERGGYPCDSFFTARTAFLLSGHTRLERNYFENFFLPDQFDYLPSGMWPMCYPSDHRDGNFIPNWALWLVLQFDEYLQRSGDRGILSLAQPKITALLDYFKKFENEHGLLEKLDGWVFVEWSKANEFVQDVNFPTNMLYAAVLEKVGQIFSDEQALAKAAFIQDQVRALSWNGRFFADNAVRHQDGLEVCSNFSEVCQYFAYYFGVATPESHPGLWRVLLEDFGPQRKKTGKHPEVAMANAFVGNYLRLEILSRAGRHQLLLSEVRDYFLNMALTTGTLWEHDSLNGSTNHGFASHIAHVLFTNALGIKKVDPLTRTITITPPHDNGLRFAQGRIPLTHAPFSLLWTHTKIQPDMQVPYGYKVVLE
ncbi:hypothetical protein QQ056_05260 [Oscillatoria laete-virens NRMC-F 0139]|nr:hypothetical protein [Oscillatoria laete-virens]MDL5052963.1 hypothetical protein [Oscillatoria laete-virens NRMC-F 0139]